MISSTESKFYSIQAVHTNGCFQGDFICTLNIFSPVSFKELPFLNSFWLYKFRLPTSMHKHILFKECDEGLNNCSNKNETMHG